MFPVTKNDNLNAGVTQLVECQLPKLNVTGSSPVTRSKPFKRITKFEAGIEDIEYTTLENIVNFLIERKLTSKQNPAILNSKISDFFWLKTKEFLVDVSNELKNDYNEIVNLMFVDSIKDESLKQ